MVGGKQFHKSGLAGQTTGIRQATEANDKSMLSEAGTKEILTSKEYRND